MITPPREPGAQWTRRPGFTLLILLLGATAGAPPVAAQVRLLDLREALVRETVQAQAADEGGGRPLRLLVSAGLVQHELVLSPNLSLGPWARSFGTRATAFEGELPNLPGSWARLTRTGSGWVGLWSDGVRHYGLDTAGNLAGMHPLAAQRPPATPMLFALADVQLLEKDFGGDTLRPTRTGEDLLGEFAEGMGGPALAAATLPTRRLSVALVADAELSALEGSATGPNLLARLNIVDGIFATQVGVRIAAGSTTLLTAGSQPFSGTDPATLLQQLRIYRGNTPAQQAAGLSHLMTGRNLDERTVGIAYIDSLCSNRFAASLSEARSGISFDALIAAHEIGHVFGAPHDGEEACAATPQDRLMATQLNGSSTFSACSLDQMAPALARASCLAPVDAADVSLGAPLTAQVALGQATPLLLTVRSDGNATVQSVELQIEPTRNAGVSVTAAVEGGGNCEVVGGLLRCALGALAPGSQRSIRVMLLASLNGSPRLMLRLAAANDVLPGNNSRNVDLLVVEGADLSVSLAAEPVRLDPGETATATATLRNLGRFPAPHTTLAFVIPAGVTVTGASPAGLSCTTSPSAVQCAPLDLASGASASLALTLRADVAGSALVTVSATSTRFDPQPENNQASVALTVTGPASASASSGSGGGGAGGVEWLLALGLMARRLWRRAGPVQAGAAAK